MELSDVRLVTHGFGIEEMLSEQLLLRDDRLDDVQPMRPTYDIKIDTPPILKVIVSNQNPES